MDTCTSGTQKRGDRATGPYDHISHGETPEKAGCSIGPVRAGAGAALEERDYGQAWGGPRRSRRAQDQFLSGGPAPPCRAEGSPGGTLLNLGCTGREASCRRGKLSAGRRRARSQKASVRCANPSGEGEEQQRDRSGGETARDHSSGTSATHFQLSLRCIIEEGHHPREAHKRTGRMNARTVGRGTLSRNPTTQSSRSGGFKEHRS